MLASNIREPNAFSQKSHRHRKLYCSCYGDCEGACQEHKVEAASKPSNLSTLAEFNAISALQDFELDDLRIVQGIVEAYLER